MSTTQRVFVLMPPLLSAAPLYAASRSMKAGVSSARVTSSVRVSGHPTVQKLKPNRDAVSLSAGLLNTRPPLFWSKRRSYKQMKNTPQIKVRGFSVYTTLLQQVFLFIIHFTATRFGRTTIFRQKYLL
jgi:hypothetical protein